MLPARTETHADERMLTARDVAERLACSEREARRILQRMAADGLPVYRRGHMVRVWWRHVCEYIERNS